METVAELFFLRVSLDKVSVAVTYRLSYVVFVYRLNTKDETGGGKPIRGRLVVSLSKLDPNL